jgi:solute carrier family 34 (sodium-dependent phosphate cotransporter)
VGRIAALSAHFGNRTFYESVGDHLWRIGLVTDHPRLGIQRETKPYVAVLQAVAFLLFLYLFFASIELMSAAFKMSGRGLAEQLLNTASDPLAGLLIGFLATSMIQSSSTTTTIVVGLVASGALTIELAVPIVMGANIGTTTTNTIVAIGHVTRPAEFERAFAASTVHDFFNLLAAFTILPIEVFFHPVQKSAVFLQSTFAGAGGMKLASPLKVVIRPLADFVTGLVPSTLPLIIIALLLLFIALRGMMKIMQGAVLSRLEGLFDRVLFRNDAASFTLGVVATASVQSSSATTSLIVPLAGTGVLSLRQVFPYTLGANVGTTITAILASFATGSPAAVTVALAHLCFNIFAIVIYYPLKALPLWMATNWGRLAAQSKGNTAGVVAVYIAAHVIPLMYILWSARR